MSPNSQSNCRRTGDYIKHFFFFSRRSAPRYYLIWRITMATSTSITEKTVISTPRTIEDVQRTIEELLVQYESDLKNSSEIANTYEKTLLKIGDELVFVSTNMTAIQFAKLKAETAKRLGNDESNINKVIKIARNSGIRANKDKLPIGWASLYLLTKIEPEEFDSFIEVSGVTVSTTRKELGGMIDTFKNTAPIAKKSSPHLVIKPTKSASSKSLIELEPLLSEFLVQHGWEIAKPKDDKNAIENVANSVSTDIVVVEGAENESEYQQQNAA